MAELHKKAFLLKSQNDLSESNNVDLNVCTILLHMQFIASEWQ
jgi:hypothetical protein